MTTWVVKLGGSLYHSDKLTAWLQQLKKISTQHQIVIVPGGGPFADQVRLSQQQWGFTNSAAHHMAILAMAQFGLLLTDLIAEAEPLYLSTSSTPSSSLSIWIPDKQILAEQHIEQTWAVSSDSLALWLAQQIQADELHIVKSAQTKHASIDQLSKLNLLDDAFPSIYTVQPVTTRLYYAADSAHYPDSGSLLL